MGHRIVALLTVVGAESPTPCGPSFGHVPPLSFSSSSSFGRLYKPSQHQEPSDDAMDGCRSWCFGGRNACFLDGFEVECLCTIFQNHYASAGHWQSFNSTIRLCPYKLYRTNSLLAFPSRLRIPNETIRMDILDCRTLSYHRTKSSDMCNIRSTHQSRHLPQRRMLQQLQKLQ